MTAPNAPDGIALGWAGPENHGIVRLARQIAFAAGSLGFAGRVVAELDAMRVPDLVDRLPPDVRLLHLHLNDWLLSSGTARAADVITALAQRLHRRDVRLTATLHDLPQPADGAELYRLRCADYRSIVALTAGVVVSSNHEQALLLDAVGEPAVPVDVIPLPIDPLPAGPSAAMDSSPATVGILGYLFPGKGHRDVIEEVAGLPTPVTVVAIGRPSPGQEYLLDDLTTLADRLGVGFRCTGYVPDAELPAELRRVTVPLAAHTRVSASGSINSWIAAGRRPLVAAGRYAAELDARLPGALRIYQPGGLRQAVETAIAEPDLTVLGPGVTVGPSTEAVAQGYLDWLRGLVRA